MHNDEQSVREMIKEMRRGLYSSKVFPIVADSPTNKVAIREWMEVLKPIISGEFRDCQILLDRIDLFVHAG